MPRSNFLKTGRLALGLAGLAPLLSPSAPTQPRANAVKFVHDPCLIKEGSDYYVFSTGKGIPIRRSRDLIHWEAIGQVFAQDTPGWARAAVPKSEIIWAPDIAYFQGRYHLYYSVSSFGSNRSVIGLATNKTLNPLSTDYLWRDEGKAFESQPGDDYNAIDSNVLPQGKARLAFVFGSFWSGVKLTTADQKTGKPLPGAPIRALARRSSPDAIEAPFLVRRNGFYYLFASFDFCCRGVRSDYNLRVGRARHLEGPYEDRAGKLLTEGGGTVLLATQGQVIGPGHCAILKDGRRWWLAHHFYDGADNGVPTLQIRPLAWDAQGWPSAGEPVSATPKVP